MEQTYRFGETCTLTATPDTCCVFSHWIDDRNPCSVYSTDAEITVQVSENMHFHAVMVPKMVTVNVLLNFPDLGTTTGSGTYECGSEVTITATTNCCYRISWRNGAFCEPATPVRERECPDCTSTISCTFTVNDDMTVYADITPVMCVALARPCPEEGGNTGVLQAQIPGVVPYFNGEPCFEYSGDGERFFSCMPVTFIASPNNGYSFLGWVPVNQNEIVQQTCNPCNTTDSYESTERIYTTDLCEDMYMVACFKRHYIVRMVFEGCSAGLVTYSVSGGEETAYSGPFFVNEGDSIEVFLDDENKCCEMTGITVNGEARAIGPFTEEDIEGDVEMVFEAETVCNTVTMTLGDGCKVSGTMEYSLDNGVSYIRYTGPVENVVNGTDMMFRFVHGAGSPCCEFSFWRYYSGSIIRTSHANPFTIRGINDDTDIECLVAYSDENNALTIDMTNVLHASDFFNFVVEDLNTHRFYGMYNCQDNVFTLLFNKCHSVKVYVSTSISNYLDGRVVVNDDPHIDWIIGRLLDENDNEYDGYIHGLITGEDEYFTYDANQYKCLSTHTKKTANAMIIELPMDTDHTIKFDFDQSSKVNSPNQRYYYNDGNGTVYTEGATAQDFKCPFLENCSPVGGIQRMICS